MRKIWVVVRREFVERVRTKWFIISTVLGPVLMIALVGLPILLATKGARERSIAVLDASGAGFGQRIAGVLDRARRINARVVTTDLPRLEAAADSLTLVVGAKELDGYLVVTDATLEDGKAEYRGTNVSSMIDMQLLTRHMEEAILTERLRRAGVDPDVVRDARRSVDLKTLKIAGSKATTESGKGSFALAYAMWLVLYMAILLYGVQVMGSVVEEKTSRIIEVLASSMRPFELMTGKILGVGAVGLFQMLIWGVSAAVLFAQQARLMALFGAPGGGDVLAISVPPVTVAIFLAYFLMGYFLYAAMFAAVAAMCSTEAEARQAANPVVMLLVVPSVMMIAILNDPQGTAAVTISMIPFASPIGMPVRWAAAPVPWVELAASLLLLAATLLAITWVAARIYRVGILMYGKRPSVRELVRWVRTA